MIHAHLRQFAQQTRYLVLGGMDGTLTALSVVAASFFSSIPAAAAFKLCLGAGIGISAASFVGAYMAEQAESSKKRAHMEKALGVERGYLAKTFFHLKQKKNVLLRALADSSTALAGTLITALPLVLLPPPSGFYAAGLLSLAVLFGIGAYMGKLGRTSLLQAGLKVAAISAAVVAVNLLVGGA